MYVYAFVNSDTAPVSSIVVPNMVQNNESEQETEGDSGDSAEVTVQNKDGGKVYLHYMTKLNILIHTKHAFKHF